MPWKQSKSLEVGECLEVLISCVTFYATCMINHFLPALGCFLLTTGAGRRGKADDEKYKEEERITSHQSAGNRAIHQKSKKRLRKVKYIPVIDN